MNSVTVPNQSGAVILDGKHGHGGPISIPAGMGKYAVIAVTVVANQDQSFLTLMRDLTPGYSKEQWAEISRDLHVEFVDSHGLVRKIQDDDRFFGSQEHIVNWDTQTNDRSGTVTPVQPGEYQFRIFSNTGKAWNNLAFSVQQTPPRK